MTRDLIWRFHKMPRGENAISTWPIRTATNCRLPGRSDDRKELRAKQGFAQDTMKKDDSMKRDDMKQDTMKCEKMSKATASIAGTVGNDGKTLVADKDGKSWKVSNPDALKGHEGHHVRVKAHVDADKDEIR